MLVVRYFSCHRRCPLLHPAPPRSVLVLLELRGGNEGLNTVAPLRDPLYRQARPRLALPEAEALPLAGSLAALLPLWQSRRLAVALGVGWPRPNRSHFKAADQLTTASPSGEGVGWLATALDRQQHRGPLLAIGPRRLPGHGGRRRPCPAALPRGT